MTAATLSALLQKKPPPEEEAAVELIRFEKFTRLARMQREAPVLFISRRYAPPCANAYWRRAAMALMTPNNGRRRENTGSAS